MIQKRNADRVLLCLAVIAVVGVIMFFEAACADPDTRIDLPVPSVKGAVSVEEAMQARRSVRAYAESALDLDEISQLLWAAQGITAKGRLRTAPSAGALYPLETYLVAGNVSGLDAGIYRYDPKKNRLLEVRSGDHREQLRLAALNQGSVASGAAVIVLSAVYERITRKYGDRGVRYAHMEAGHAAQNVYLQCVSLDMGTVVVGAFQDEKVREIIGMEDGEHPLYLMPLGRLPVE